MKWKTFFQIVLILLILAGLFYIVCPKYGVYSILQGGGLQRYNKMTGKVEVFVFSPASSSTIEEIIEEVNWRTLK